jgi:hypothetical protein
MIKTKAMIEVKYGDNIYSMECPANAKLGEVHDALVDMRNIVVGIMQSHIDQDQKENESNEEE